MLLGGHDRHRKLAARKVEGQVAFGSLTAGLNMTALGDDPLCEQKRNRVPSSRHKSLLQPSDSRPRPGRREAQRHQPARCIVNEYQLSTSGVISPEVSK
jgi:hypothetical protein